MKKVYTVILNYKNWRDTVECLESVLKLDYPDYQVIVVDNDSPDDSLTRMIEWAEGKVKVEGVNERLKHLVFPEVPKPIPYVVYDRKTAERGGNKATEKSAGKVSDNHPYSLVFIRSDENLGFSGGNNIALRYALSKGDFEYVWILNNDTVVEKSSLTELVEMYNDKSLNLGILGSKLLFYHAPETIQAVGGIYRKCLGISRHMGEGETDIGQYDNLEVWEKLNYVIGASMLVSKGFLEDVGLLCEDYFLYYDDLDWSVRAVRKGYRVGVCWKSVIYHKEGGSIGSDSSFTQRSLLSEYYSMKNRIVFTKKFYPWCLPTVLGGFTVTVARRVIRGDWRRLKVVVEAIIDGLKGKRGRTYDQ